MEEKAFLADLPEFPEGFIEEERHRQELRALAHEVVDQYQQSQNTDVWNEADVVSFLTNLLNTVGIILGTGALALFSCDLYHYVYKNQGYQAASNMPWTIAGVASSGVAVLMLIVNAFKRQ